MSKLEQAFDLQFFGVEFLGEDINPGELTPETPAQIEEGTPPTEGQPAAEPSQPKEDSFTSIDPNSLPPELQATYKSLQADYTRKTQEAAPYRKFAEQTGMGIDDLQRVLTEYNQFSNVLQNNPAQLVQALFQQGRLTKEQAVQMLGLEPPKKEPGIDLSDNPYAEDRELQTFLNAQLQKALGEAVKPYQEKISALEQWKQTREQADQAQKVSQFKSAIEQKFSQLKEKFPDIDENKLWQEARRLTLPPEDADLAVIKAYGGLEQFLDAQKKKWAQERVNDRVQDSDSVPRLPSGPPVVTSPKEPETFNDLKEELLNFARAKNKT
jgi:hypothetical protein